MTVWAKGFWIGVAAGFVLAGILASTTRFEAFVRVSSGDRLLLDARVDEPAFGRVINIPVATLGEVALVKRSWLVATTYDFHLGFRPEVSPGPGRAVQDVGVSVFLPGTVTATNATRVAGGVAMWETIPIEGIQVRTRAIHWVPIVLVLAVAAFLGIRRRS